MKYAIWNYNEGKYCESNNLPLEFETEAQAETFATEKSKNDMELGIFATLEDAREYGYCIEEIEIV